LGFRSITRKFFRLEIESNYFNEKISNVYFWDLIRWNVHRQVIQKSGLHGEAQQIPKKETKKIFEWFSYCLKTIFLRNAFLSQRCDILFFGHPRRKKLSDGFWWDIYCDPIIEYIRNDFDCLLIEKPYLKKHLTPSKTYKYRYLDFPYLLADLLRKIKIFNIKLSEHEEILLEKIQEEIEKAFNVALEDLKPIVEQVLCLRISHLFIYVLLLRLVKPKIAVVICNYDNKIFIEACTKCKVPVLELQHGSSMGAYHLGYSFPQINMQRIRFPNYLLVFGDFWRKRAEYPISPERIYSVGFPFFEMEASKYKFIEKNHQILFISQGTIGKELSKFAVELSKRNDIGYDIVYKLHPGEYRRWRKEYPWLATSKINVIKDDKTPLYKLFAASMIQVGVYSTAIYEGLGFGLRTVLIDLPGIEYMDELIENGIVSVLTDVDEFVAYLSLTNKKQESDAFLFKKYALENITKVFAGVIEK
jgi:hypothetical protein